MEPSLSAVVVPVPAAEPRVGDLRAALDPSAALGVPAHVTLMFPFLPPADLDDAALAALRAVLAAAPPFDVGFSRVAWFDEDVVWWAPEPAAPFVALTHAITARFGLRPYEGAHGDDVVPHLTIGHRTTEHRTTEHRTTGHDVPADRLRAAADEVAAGPALHTTVRSAVLMTGSREPGSWSTVAELPLHGG